MNLFSRSVRRGLVAGAAVVVLGGAAVGIAAAQTQPTPTAQPGQARYQAFIDALAKRLNLSSANLETAITGARTDAGLSAGRGFPGGEGGGRGRGGVDLNAAATAIGIPVAQLRTELQGKSLAQVASAHGKSATDVATVLKNAAHTQIDQAVAAGKVTADQATARKTATDQRIDQVVNQVQSQRGGPGGQGGAGGPGGAGPRGGFGGDLNAAATAIGIPVAQLRTELQGKSLAQVASAHGKSASDVTTALQNAAHTRIDQAVTDGKMAADQATAQKTQADQRIDQFVNQVRSQGGGKATPSGGGDSTI